MNHLCPIWFALVLATLLLPNPAAAQDDDWRTIEFETTEVTGADVALSPDGEWLIFTMLGHLFRLPIEGGTAEQLTFGPYYDTDPAVSPDGRRIAFVSDRDGSEGNIFLLNPENREISQVTREPWAARPAWSPDGEFIAYLSVLRESPNGRSVPGHSIPETLTSRVRRVSIDGGDPENVTDTPQLISSIFYFPDGRLGWSAVDLALDRPAGPERASTRIEVLDAQGNPSIVRKVAGFVSPLEVSPAGDGFYGRRFFPLLPWVVQRTEDLLFLSPSGNTDRLIRGLSHPRGRTPRFAISRDAKNLYIGQFGRLWKISVGSASREFIPFDARVKLEIREPLEPPRWQAPAVGTRAIPRAIQHPRLSPDDRTLVFGAAGYLWQRSLDGGPAERLFEGNAFEREPAFSPDGRQLAYVSGPLLIAMWEGREEVRVFDFERQTTRVLTSGLAYTGLSWSPDGKQLLFMELGGPFEAWTPTLVALAADGTRQEFGETGSWEPRPHLSADQQSLYFSSSPPVRGALYRLPLNGGAEREVLTRLERQLDRARVSPDEKRLAFQRNAGIWVAQLGEQPIGEDDVRELSPEGGDSFDFTPDGSSLIYATGSRIWRQPLGGAERLEIATGLELRYPTPRPVLLHRVRRLDFTRRGFLPEASLLLAEGRIQWIGSALDEASLPPDTLVLDAGGRFAIPGLFDMHVHASESLLSGYIAYGVTSVRDVGGPLLAAAAAADRSDVTSEPVPRYFFSGDLFAGAQPPVRGLQIASVAEVRQLVQLWKRRGAQFIKVYDPLSWPLQRAVVDEARQQGLPVIGHSATGGVEMTTKSVILGYTTLEHHTRGYDDIHQMLAAAGTLWDPTLSTPGNALSFLDEPERLDAKLLAVTPAWQIEWIRTGEMTRALGDEERGRWVSLLAGVRAAHRRGVKLLAGTDRMSGVALHWELEYLVDAGLEPLEVLRIATEGGAAAVGADDELGTLEVGKLADIVLLDRNPLEDIKNTQTIWRTIKGGWVFDPEKLRPPESDSTTK